MCLILNFVGSVTMMQVECVKFNLVLPNELGMKSLGHSVNVNLSVNNAVKTK